VVFGEGKEQDDEGEGVGGWEEERRKFWGDQRIIGGNEERQRMDWKDRFKKIEKRYKEEKKEERERIRNFRYNRWYQWIRGKRIPGYLSNGWGKSR